MDILLGLFILALFAVAALGLLYDLDVLIEERILDDLWGMRD